MEVMKIAQVTVELRNLLKTDFELFDFEYEFDDKAFAKQIEQAVIDAYYTSEIGQETPDDFKRVFKRRWLQAMSYYNKLYNTTLLEYNPLINYKMSEALEQLAQTTRNEDTTNQTSSEGSSDGTTNTTTSGNNTRTDDLKNVTNASDTTSDYPQQAIGSGDYLSGQRLSDSESKDTGTVENTSSSNTDVLDHTTMEDNTSSTGNKTLSGTDNTSYEKTIEGLTGKTYQELIQLERNNIMRITGMVVDEMKPCFILVY